MQTGNEKRQLCLCMLCVHVLCCIFYVYVFVHACMLVCASVYKKKVKRQLTSIYKLQTTF